jgi:hypothetical protein
MRGATFFLALRSLLAAALARAMSAFVVAPRASHLRARPMAMAADMAPLPPMFTGPLPSGSKAVIFDIDGTLADSFQLAFSATNKVLTNNNFPPITAEQYHFGCRYTTPVRLATHTGLSPSDADFEARGAKLGAEFDALYIGMVDAKTAGFYPGMHELIRRVPSDVKIGKIVHVLLMCC